MKIDAPQGYPPPVSVPVPKAQSTLGSESVERIEPLNSVPAVPSEKISYEDASIQEIDITKISPNPFQPRKVFEPQALKELADSIKEHGVIQPLVVTKIPTGYELVVGERRFRASLLAGLQAVPAIIKEQMVDQTKLEVALIENIQRKELNPIEEAQAYERLMQTFNLTQEQVAKKVGKSRPAVANTVRLLNLPAEVQRAVIEGRLMEGHARALLGLNDPEKVLLLYKVVIEKKWNVREVEEKVRELTQKKSLDSAAPDPKLMAMESELRIKLGAQVKIQRQGQGGKITIDFYSDEELLDIIRKMAQEKASEEAGYLTV
ncbi:MAG: ParB/RepB/Spo0J family partition protein [Candidatus Doudnabacteria bacterium]|nr:ParB/RepB/Spo0J family partition protein [Candidatus Doudnabacteria bacterium]